MLKHFSVFSKPPLFYVSTNEPLKLLEVTENPPFLLLNRRKAQKNPFKKVNFHFPHHTQKFHVYHSRDLIKNPCGPKILTLSPQK